MLEDWPAMPGEVLRPPHRNRILVSVRRDGALLAVVKALDGEGPSRFVGCSGVSDFSRCRCEEEGEVHAGDSAGVIDGAMCGLRHNFLAL